MEERFEPYQIILEESSAQIIEKKSRFLATLSPVQNQEEATAFVERQKKRYWDASHNCYAYVIGQGAALQRCSDDGEPQGTAGRPMLEVLLGAGIINTAAVVNRYFGGTLLGTGGLVRAYTQATQAGLAASTVATMRYGTALLISADYNSAGKITYLFEKLGLTPTDLQYTDSVSMRLLLGFEEEARVRKELVEATAGRISITALGCEYFIDKSK